MQGHGARTHIAGMHAGQFPDWRIEDVIALCAAFGIACTAPRKAHITR